MITQTAEQALTHHVRLVLMNDQPIYQTCRELVAAAPKNEAGEALKSLCEDITLGWEDDLHEDSDPTHLIREVLTTALAFVDWDDIADDFRDDVQDPDMFDENDDPFLDDKIDRLKEARREGH